MAPNPISTHRMIQAKERGKPKMSGVADEKIACPGQIMARAVRIITVIKMRRDERIPTSLAGAFFL